MSAGNEWRFRTRLAILAVLIGTASEAGAAPLYSVTDLGVANPNTSYMGQLSATEQAAFGSGSFDQWSHPASVTFPYTFGFSDEAGSPPGHNWSDPTLVSQNDEGQVVGWAIKTSYSEGDTSPLIYSPGLPAASWQTSGTSGLGFFSIVQAGGEYVQANAINDANQLAGTSTSTNGNTSEAVLIGIYPAPSNSEIGRQQASQVTPLGTLGGAYSSSNALNNAGQVVGWSATPQTVYNGQPIPGNPNTHAFLYSNGTMQDLNNLIPPSSTFVLNNAVGIDASGQIVVFGADASGAEHEYLLTPLGSPTPVPEASTLAIFGFLATGLFARRLRDRRTRR